MTDKLSAGRTPCSCGLDHDPALVCEGTSDAGLRKRVETAVLRAAFPDAMSRRALLSAVGATTVSAALSQIFPIATATDAFAQSGPLEKSKLAVGFIPITCATPIIMAHPLGFYAKQKLDVDVVKTAGWAVVRDKTINKEYDAAHMLAPMPLAISMGLGSTAMPFTVPAIENVNGQAICLAMKFKDRRDPKSWKGMKFAIPFDYSIHNYLLRYYLAENGLDPDQDLQLRVVPPPEMVANLRAGNIDGFLAPDSIVQRAVFDGIGFIHLISKELWDGHPCCSFSTRADFAAEMPNTYAALLRAIMEASAYSAKPEHRKQIAEAIAPANYINAPVTVLEQVLTGTYADGLGGVKQDPNRVTFDPFPYESFAIWIMTQMKRWGQVKGDIDYAGIARKVFLTTEAGRAMKDAGLPVPAAPTKSFAVMGKTFDPSKPEDYVKSFKIGRSA
jgi:nitrate/nitrite transport system substrate-binding protein